MKEETRMAGKYQIIQAIHIGDKEVVFGEDKTNKEYPYICGYATFNMISQQYSDVQASADYLDIMKIFCNRVSDQIELVKSEKEKITVPLECITAEQCYPNDYNKSIDGKVVAIKASALRREYQTADNQLVLINGGFGSAANARGNACFTKNLYNGEESRYERYDIQGEIKPEHMPEWAKAKLKELNAKAMEDEDEMEM